MRYWMVARSVVAYVKAPSVLRTMNGASVAAVKTTVAPSLGTASALVCRSATTAASIGL